MKVLIDTNVLVDVLTERAPFHVTAGLVWSAVESGRVAACVSSISFTTVYYLARRLRGRPAAIEAVRKTSRVYEIAPVDRGVIDRAAAIGMPDFEDAVQAFAGLSAGATHVVTRDPAGFVGGPLEVLTPDQFLATLRRL